MVAIKNDSCPHCGRPIPRHATEGLCAPCLLGGVLNRGAMAPEDRQGPELPRGSRIGDYDLLESIGRGGMGVVFRARHVALENIVAIKMIAAGDLAAPEDLRRFHREAEAASKLHHPNIVPVFSVGEDAGRHYFVMKFAEGGSLADSFRCETLCAPPPFDDREAAELILKLPTPALRAPTRHPPSRHQAREQSYSTLRASPWSPTSAWRNSSTRVRP